MKMWPKKPANYEEFRIQCDELEKHISKNILSQYSLVVTSHVIGSLLLTCIEQLNEQDHLVAQGTKENVIKHLNEIFENHEKTKSI